MMHWASFDLPLEGVPLSEFEFVGKFLNLTTRPALSHENTFKLLRKFLFCCLIPIELSKIEHFIQNLSLEI